MTEKCPNEPERNSSGERLYRDSSGDKCTLRTMIYREQGWVVSRFAFMEAEVARLAKELANAQRPWGVSMAIEGARGLEIHPCEVLDTGYADHRLMIDVPLGFGWVVELQAANARLQAIVDKLAKTANGVIVEPRMRLWYIVRTHPEPLWIDVDHAVDASHPGEPPDWCVWGRTQHEEAEMISLCICYSTYRAAEAAKEKP